MADAKKWVKPKWLEKYESHLSTGDFTAEELMNRLRNDKNLMQTNIVLYVMAANVEAQITLLSRLHQAELLP